MSGRSASATVCGGDAGGGSSASTSPAMATTWQRLRCARAGGSAPCLRMAAGSTPLGSAPKNETVSRPGAFSSAPSSDAATASSHASPCTQRGHRPWSARRHRSDSKAGRSAALSRSGAAGSGSGASSGSIRRSKAGRADLAHGWLRSRRYCYNFHSRLYY
jgi:hypothetical protein